MFSNNSLTRISTGVAFDESIVPTSGPVPTSSFVEYGLFYGIGQSTSLTVLTSQFGVSSTTGGGLIASPADRQSALRLVGIPGTSPGETDVWLQVAAWPAAYGTDYVSAYNAFLADPFGFHNTFWGQSTIANITAGLGATTGPGANIWGAATNTSGTVIPAFYIVQNIPEPGIFALAGLSAAILIVRRPTLLFQYFPAGR